MSALSKQISGNHYKQFAIQPVEFIHKNKIPYCEANAIKYLCRWREKNGIEDLKKAIHYIELLMELENDDASIHTRQPGETRSPTGSLEVDWPVYRRSTT